MSCDLHAQLHRRRQAAARSVPLGCGCRDPWPCRCYWPRLSVASAIAAAEHLEAHGLTPVFDADQFDLAGGD